MSDPVIPRDLLKKIDQFRETIEEERRSRTPEGEGWVQRKILAEQLGYTHDEIKHIGARQVRFGHWEEFREKCGDRTLRVWYRVLKSD